MDYLALRHIGVLGTKAISVRIMPETKAEELLQHCQPGDTVHKIPEDIKHDMYLVWGTIDYQLANKEFVQVPA